MPAIQEPITTIEPLPRSAIAGLVLRAVTLLGSEARQRISNCPDFATAAVGALRYELGRHPEDRQLATLVGELRAEDPDIDQWWTDQRVTDRTSVTKRIAHPTAGPLSFGIESVIGPHDPEQRLVIYTVEPGSATALALALLAS